MLKERYLIIAAGNLDLNCVRLSIFGGSRCFEGEPVETIAPASQVWSQRGSWKGFDQLIVNVEFNLNLG